MSLVLLRLTGDTMRRSILLFLFYFILATAIASPAQTFTTLHNFAGSPDGAVPYAGLVQATDGNLYGTTANGGLYNFGAVFQITPTGTLTTLYSFCSQPNCTDGGIPWAGLVQANDGNFYGTTTLEGANGEGTVFKITPSGVLTTLHSFTGYPTDGYQPSAVLLQGSDGSLYGTTLYGGQSNICMTNGCGTVFKVSPGGGFTTVYSFCTQVGCPDGFNPRGALIQAADGNFYGTTLYGGINTGGTVFQMTPGGTLTTLYSFCAGFLCPDGDDPYAGLVQASDSNFYGTTYFGGTDVGAGTVFKITPQGVLTTLHSFSGSDGANPYAALVQASDGNLYGTTYGAYGASTVFKITPQGELTTLHSFGYGEGQYPYAGLVQASDGNLYGTTSKGGDNNAGTVFRLDAGLRALLSVSKVGGGGVSSADGHIYCGAVCSYSYLSGSDVTLSAVPASGYTFTGWSGCDNMNGSYCSVLMTSAKDVIATFTSANVMLSSLTFKPSYVKGGHLSAGTLTLNAAAPPGGVTVALSSDHPGVAHPPSFVFVPGGKSSVGFAVKTFPVKSNTTVTITATAGSSQVSGTLMVGTTSLPPSLK